MIVGGIVGLIQVASASGSIPTGAQPFAAGAAALHAGSIVVGLLVRLGRAWLLALNYAAVLGFIDLLGAGANPLLLMLGLADVLVVGIVLAHKPWFEGMRAWRAGLTGPDPARWVSP